MSATASRTGGDCARRGGRRFDLLAPEYETLDPNPDLHALFQEYNVMFFDGKLAGCEVKWSPRMTLCYQPRSGFCSIRLSEPLLKLRPRSDMVNTLLHEMIHAYVFVSSPVKDHDDHGPVFQSHMHRINQDAGTKITVFHTFHDEVDAYRQHWWQCDGPCRRQKPFFGLVKRAMNRPPGPTDRWWPEHQQKCGGAYTKIKEPPEFTRKQEAKRLREEKKRARASPSIDGFFAASGAKSGGARRTTREIEEGSNACKKSKTTETKGVPEHSAGVRGGAASDEEKPRASDAARDLSITRASSSPPFFPVVVATGANGEEELLLVGDLDVVLQPSAARLASSGRPSAGASSDSLSRSPSRRSRLSRPSVVDLTVSETESEDEARLAALEPPPAPRCPRNPRAAPEVIEID